MNLNNMQICMIQIIHYIPKLDERNDMQGMHDENDMHSVHDLLWFSCADDFV